MITFTELHESRIRPGEANEANFVLDCACGARVSIAAASADAALVARDQHVEREAATAARALVSITTNDEGTSA